MTMRESIQTQHQNMAPLRVLLAVHGHEPAEWALGVCRVVSGWTNASVRVLGVVDVPSPPFTSLLPPARRFYDAARSAWRRDGEPRVRAAVDRLAQTLGRTIEMECSDSPTRLPTTRGAGPRT